MSQCAEIRSFNLKPGTRAEFHRLFVEKSALLLKQWQIEVAAYGPSRHDSDSYYVIRTFPSIETREQIEDAYYGSPEWRQGPRESILALIENYTTIVLMLDDQTVEGLRHS